MVHDLVLGFLERYVKGIESDYPAIALDRHPAIFVRNRDYVRRQVEVLGIGGGVETPASVAHRTPRPVAFEPLQDACDLGN